MKPSGEALPRGDVGKKGRQGKELDTKSRKDVDTNSRKDVDQKSSFSRFLVFFLTCDFLSQDRNRVFPKNSVSMSYFSSLKP